MTHVYTPTAEKSQGESQTFATQQQTEQAQVMWDRYRLLEDRRARK